MMDKPYITLGQFLKLNDFVNSGGEAKHLIHTFSIQVNGEDNHQRGKKLYPGDVVVINGERFELDHEDQ